MPQLHLGDLTITSPAFEHGAPIPSEFTIDGDNVSPPLVWDSVPEGTRELAIICHDPDAPLTSGFTHWVLYGIPVSAGGVERAGGSAFVQGINDSGAEGYLGPAPPPGHGLHHYYFHLYALREAVDGGSGRSATELIAAIDGSIIEQARVVGTFSR